jgi:hypothetical protein
MKKNHIEPITQQLKTYHMKRACVECGEPIADQERITRIHCPQVKDDNGKVIKDCKRRKHQRIHQTEEDYLLDWNAMQRETKKKIEAALKDHGDELTKQMLNAYHIMLDTCIRNYKNGGTTVIEFLGYDIILNPNYITLKIIKNDK